jgi:UrcA family protein
MYTPSQPLTCFLACAAGAIASLALAQPSHAADSRVVRFDDLNLRADAGVARLYDRLRVAARQVCGASYTTNLYAKTSYRRCVSETLSRAVAEVDVAELTARHEKQDGPHRLAPAVIAVRL